MTKQKSLKKSLAKSAVAMTLCAGMLIGSTYAWFSDSASTQDITITAGNLDVDIVDENGDSLHNMSIFRDNGNAAYADFKWEPGAMWVSDTFKIKNLGNLALQYLITLQPEEEESEEPNILDVVQMKVVDRKVLEEKGIKEPSSDAGQQERKAFWDKISETEGAEVSTGTLNAQNTTTESLSLVLYWVPDPSTDVNTEKNNDNKYNIKADDYNSKKLSATFKLNVFATQTPKEEDSFGPNYDSNLIPTSSASLTAALKDAKDSGKPVDLHIGADIKDLKEMSQITAGSTIDGAGHTVSASASKGATFITVPTSDTTTTLKNLTIENNAEASSDKKWGMVIGNDKHPNSTGDVVLENCTIKADGRYALGVNNGAKVTLKNCTLEGWSALEVADSSEVTLENCTLIGTNTYNGEDNTYGTINLYGNKAKVTLINCTVKAVEKGDAKQYCVACWSDAQDSQVTNQQGNKFYENGSTEGKDKFD